jgi:short-subunit dehydrogenase
MKKAIIIGASSGIGRELARIIAANGYIVGLAARRTELLHKLNAEITSKTYIKTMDLAKPDEAILKLHELIAEMNGVDLIIISSGTGYINPELDWAPEKNTLDVNVTGFTAMVNVAWKHFREKGGGIIVGISSIAAIRGSAAAPAYNASKSFVSNYLSGLRYKAWQQKANIKIIDIKPGFIDTEMAKGEGLFWVASPEKAAAQIYHCIQKGTEKAYITKRWVIIAWIFKLLPDWLFCRL